MTVKRASRPKSSKRKTIKFSELKRLSFANSDEMPRVVEIHGKRHQWVGIGWVNEGKLKGDEVRVVEG